MSNLVFESTLQIFHYWLVTYACVLSRVQLFVTPQIVDCKAPLSMGLPYQEYWSEMPFHSPGDLLNPREEPVSSEAPALVGEFLTTDLAIPTSYTQKVIKICSLIDITDSYNWQYSIEIQKVQSGTKLHRLTFQFSSLGLGDFILYLNASVFSSVKQDKIVFHNVVRIKSENACTIKYQFLAYGQVLRKFKLLLL